MRAVHEHRMVATVLLDHALTVAVVPVVRHVAVLADRHQAVLLVPGIFDETQSHPCISLGIVIILIAFAFSYCNHIRLRVR